MQVTSKLTSLSCSSFKYIGMHEGNETYEIMYDCVGIQDLVLKILQFEHVTNEFLFQQWSNID